MFIYLCICSYIYLRYRHHHYHLCLLSYIKLSITSVCFSTFLPHLDNIVSVELHRDHSLFLHRGIGSVGVPIGSWEGPISQDCMNYCYVFVRRLILDVDTYWSFMHTHQYCQSVVSPPFGPTVCIWIDFVTLSQAIRLKWFFMKYTNHLSSFEISSFIITIIHHHHHHRYKKKEPGSVQEHATEDLHRLVAWQVATRRYKPADSSNFHVYICMWLLSWPWPRTQPPSEQGLSFHWLPAIMSNRF